MTKEAFAFLRNIPSLRYVPASTLIAIIIALAVFGFLFLLLILYFIADFIRIEREEHKAPDAHRLIMDLQKTLISEMRGTSKQNALMIFLTIIFITVTVIGIGISILGGEKTLTLLKRVLSQISSSAKSFKLPSIK